MSYYIKTIIEMQRLYPDLKGPLADVETLGVVATLCTSYRVPEEVVATFFQTNPPTLIAERGDQVSLIYLQPPGSGSKYQGQNKSFWEHHGEAIEIWGYGSTEMRCERRFGF